MVTGTAPVDEVSVIVPTLARPERRAALLRALESIHRQVGVIARPIVVVNGDACDPHLLRSLAQDDRLLLLRQAAADLPAALQLGCRHLAAPWFTSLDDDDEFTPSALYIRVQALKASLDADAVVTNGIRRTGGRDELAAPDMHVVAVDPLGALAESNWLLPGAWLLRNDDHARTLLGEMPRYLECTYLAIQLCTRRKVTFVDDPTVIWHGDTPGSLSKSSDYRLGQVEALRRLLGLDLTPVLRRRMRARLSGAHHDCASLLIALGKTRQAWRHHLLSLAGYRGLRFLPYTWRLLLSRQADGMP